MGKTCSCSLWFPGLTAASVGGFRVQEVEGRVVRFCPENNKVRERILLGNLKSCGQGRFKEKRQIIKGSKADG